MRDLHILLTWGWYKIPMGTTFPIVIIISRNEAIRVLEVETDGTEARATKQEQIIESHSSKNTFLGSLKRKGILGIPDKFYTPQKRKAA